MNSTNKIRPDSPRQKDAEPLKSASTADNNAVKESPLRLSKFKTVEALLAAYTALEREFTARCVLLAKTQRELAAIKAASAPTAPLQEQSEREAVTETPPATTPLQEQSERETVTETPSATTLPQEQAEREAVTETPPATTPPQEQAETARNHSDYSERLVAAVQECAGEIADRLALNADIMAACMERYKRLLRAAPRSGVLCGSAVLTPIEKPKTLADAKRLADELLK